MELFVFHIEPGFRVPMLNDTNYGHTSSIYYLYELHIVKSEAISFLYVLKELFIRMKRAFDNLEAFI